MSLTKDERAEIVRLSQAGLTQRQIADKVGCSQRTAGRILASEEIPRRQRMDTRAKATARKSDPGPAEAQAPDVSALAADLDTMPVELVARRLSEVSAFADEMREAGNVIAFRDLVKLEADIAARLEAMRPPPAPDPSLDPANVAAAAETRRMLADLVAAMEAASQRIAPVAPPQQVVDAGASVPG
jgi:transcriptional regulator with XRE-family HTH domain